MGERLDVAKAIRVGLEYSDTTRVLWSDPGSVFKPSGTTIEDLSLALGAFDFGVFVLQPDDVLKLGGKGRNPVETLAVRDNVLFEFGLFMGALGRERVFGIVPRRKEMRRPTDLAGVQLLSYDDADPNLQSALGNVCGALAEQFATLKAR